MVSIIPKTILNELRGIEVKDILKIDIKKETRIMSKKIFISLVLVLSMLVTLSESIYGAPLPTSSFDMSAYALTFTDDPYHDEGIRVGRTQPGSTSYDYYPVNQIFTITGISTTNNIIIDGITVNIIIDDLDIQLLGESEFAPISLINGAIVNLTLVGDSTLGTVHNDYPALQVETGETINIDGLGSLTANTNGFLSAGIGGANGSNGGTINILGGTITASSRQAASIGGGVNGAGGLINISGGTVAASATGNGAAIGGGSQGAGGIINISGGTVTASGDFGAGIGGGYGGSAGITNISGGEVTAYSINGTGIGSGRDYLGATSTLTIYSPAVVKAGSSITGTTLNDNFVGDVKFLMGTFETERVEATNVSVYKKSTNELINSLVMGNYGRCVAFTVPANDTYIIKSDNVVQMHSVTPSGDFIIAEDIFTEFTGLRYVAQQLTPSFSTVSGEVISGTAITISSTNADAIYYTIDGSAPTVSSIKQAVIPLVIDAAMTVKAMAVKAGKANSEITTESYTLPITVDMTNIELSETATGYIFSGDTYLYEAVMVENLVENITITPTGTGTITVDGIEVISGGDSGIIDLIPGVEKTIIVIATEIDKSPKTYTIKLTRELEAQATPSFSSVSGAITAGTTVTISSIGADAIYYTTDGSEPTEASYNQVTTPLVIDVEMTVKAIALKAGIPNSSVTTASYTIGVTPVSGSGRTHSKPRTTTNGNDVGRLVDTTQSGETTTTIILDEEKIEQKLMDQGDNPVISISASTGTDIVKGELNGQMVKNMENNQVVIEIKTDTATYSLPAEEINIDAISNQLDTKVVLSDIKVVIEISSATENQLQIVANTAKDGEFTVVGAPIEFNINCSYGDKTVVVNKFDAYIERSIAIPEGVDPEKITTGIIINLDGTIRHVPTKIIIIDGIYYAKINSLTNSTYLVIWNPIEFIDVESHWAKESINNMGSRMVVSGAGDGMFEPERAITRAEFTTSLVRSLGLDIGLSNSRFEDVESTDWYSDYIETAYEYGLILGINETEFRPMDSITREQVMIMISRALEITDLNVEITADAMASLLNYSDIDDMGQSSEEANESMAICIKAGIVLGRGCNLLAPSSEITRAEAIVIIERLLQKSNLI